MKLTLTTAGLVLLVGSALSVAQPQSDRARLSERLDALRAEQAQVESDLAAIDEAEPGGAGEFRDLPPELADRFERLRREHPDRAESVRRRHGERFDRLRELREKDPEAYRARLETMQALRRSSELAAEVAALEDAGKQPEADAVREDLRREAEFIFERMLEQRRAEIAEIEDRLASARERLEEMETNGIERLDERIEQAIVRARDRGDRVNREDRPRRRRR